MQFLVESTLAHASRHMALYLVSAALVIAALMCVSRAVFEIFVLLKAPSWMAYLMVGVLNGGIAAASFLCQSRRDGGNR